MSNVSEGHKFEREFCELLAADGYWVHNMTQSQAGQPADVVAVKFGKATIIDCKNCEGNYFDLRRVESNQRYSMELWNECGNGCGWFAVKMGSDIHMVPSFLFFETNKSRVDKEWLKENAYTVDEWERLFG